MMVCKRYLLSNMAVLGIYVNFQRPLFEGQPLSKKKTRPFPIKTKVICVLGMSYPTWGSWEHHRLKRAFR